jgi:hypothetical protein
MMTSESGEKRETAESDHAEALAEKSGCRSYDTLSRHKSEFRQKIFSFGLAIDN